MATLVLIMALNAHLLVLNTATKLGIQDIETCDGGPCRAGEYFDLNTSKCLSCEDGTFMAQDHHKCTDCKPCMKAEPDLEESELYPCTKVSDTVIGCIDGHFRTFVDGWPEPVCEKCSECGEGQVMIKKCGLDNDTVCEPDTSTGGAGSITAVQTPVDVTKSTAVPNTTHAASLESGNRDVDGSAGGHEILALLLFGIILIIVAVILIIVIRYYVTRKQTRNETLSSFKFMGYHEAIPLDESFDQK